MNKEKQARFNTLLAKGIPPISMTTDFAGSGPEMPYPNALREIGNSDFRFVHWCHDWSNNVVYSFSDVKQIDSLLKQADLNLVDTHASDGKASLGKDPYYWLSDDDKQAAKGLGLIANRIAFTSDLGGRAIVLHVPAAVAVDQKETPLFNRLTNRIEMVVREGEERGIVVAVENVDNEPNMPTIKKLLERFPDTSYLGLTYDSGHGNIWKGLGGLGGLMVMKDRLYALHLHDNRGPLQNPDLYKRTDPDEHMLPDVDQTYFDTVGWDTLALILSQTPYVNNWGGILTFETGMRPYKEGPNKLTHSQYLDEAFDRGLKLHQKVESFRG